MEATSSELSAPENSIKNKILIFFSGIPVLGWLVGALAAVILEQIVGRQLALSIGLPKIPALFGFTLILKTPALIPSSVLYVIAIYLLPVIIVSFMPLTGEFVS